jgi:imidazolonepropionase-like amidohydrolase
MRSIVSLATAVLLGVAVYPSLAGDTLVILADKIYPSPDNAALSNGSVLVRRGHISAVADEHARIAIPAGTQTSECRGVVVAGFQNSHVHFTEDVWTNAAQAPADRLAAGLDAMLTRYGFTTVFDTGSDQANTIALRQRIEKGRLRGPRIFTVGLPLFPPGGIPFYIHDLPPDVLGRMHQPRNADEARADVRQNLARGANATKLFLHTSPDGKSPRFMSLDIASAAAEETHARRKLVLAHPTSLEGVRVALASGVDVLVHTTPGEQVAWDEALVGQLIAKHLSVVPTLKLWDYELRKDQVPPEGIRKFMATAQQELQAFSAAGGQVLFGTDVGYMHDYDPTDEYVLMAGAGLTPMQILASLTTAPAARWQESERRGRVAPNMDADLVVLAGDPVSDVRNFARVRCVFRAGRLIYKARAP